MSTNVFGIFQIGPVQELITCAKKTQDFWSGSYLLSFLNCVAIDRVVQSCGGNKDVTIYPSLDNQALFNYVQGLRKSGQEPWKSKAKDEQLTPTVPNRFVCNLKEDQASTILQQAEEVVRSTFFRFVNYVKLKLEAEISKRFLRDNPIQCQDIWDEIWTRQGRKFFEIYWAICSLDSANYSKSYQQAEALFGARKAVRDFEPITEPGYKCTLCGQREPLHVQPDGSLKRKNLRKFWERVRQATGYRFREEEHLCAICTIKRLAPNYIFGRPSDFPSTSSVAVADFVRQTVKEYNKNPKIFQKSGEDLLWDFVQKARKVRQQVNLDFEIEPLPQHKASVETIPRLLAFARLDGDWLIQDTYENIGRQGKADPADVESASDSLKTLVDKMKNLMRSKDFAPFGPGKYYAIFQMDGDSIGEKVGQKQSEEEHRQFSKLLCDFSLNRVPQIVENNYLGKIIYFGGDEGVTFVSLEDILAAIEECHQSFEKQITDTTACIGAVIAHYEQPLLQVLSEVRQALGRIKDWEKNGFCIALMKRSGGTTYAMAHWEYNGLKVIPLLQELIKHYRAGRISDRWYYQFATEELGLKQTRARTIRVNIEAAQLEISRLILRHADKTKIDTDTLNQLIQKLKDLVYDIDKWEELTALMDVAAYIARGGGR